MSSKPSVLDSDCGSMELIQRHLTALDGSRGKFVTYKPSHAAVVLWIASVHVHVPSVYLDCMICSAMVIRPCWEPTGLRIEPAPGTTSGLILTDAQMLRLECKSIRLVETELSQLWYATPAYFNFFDLLNDYRSSSKLRCPSSFAALCLYLQAYNSALMNQGNRLRTSGPSIDAFRVWLKTKLGYIKLSCGWQYVITEKFSDDLVAYEQFFRLVDEFLSGYANGTITEPDMHAHYMRGDYADPGLRESEEDF